MKGTIRLECGVEVVFTGGAKQKCRSCGAEIYWVKTDKGKSMPINADLKKSHFATCPEHKQWRKRDVKKTA